MPQGELRLGIRRCRKLSGEAGDSRDLADKVSERYALSNAGQFAPGCVEAGDPLARVVRELRDLLLRDDRVGEAVAKQSSKSPLRRR